MQIIYQNEDEESSSRRADIIDPFICIEGIGRYIEGEYIKRFGRRVTRI